MQNPERAVVFVFLLAIGAAYSQNLPPKAVAPERANPPGWQAADISPQTGATQGYATDGSSNYLFSTARITLYDAEWHAPESNTEPFAGLPDGIGHLGDGEYYDGKLYVPAEQFLSCGNFSHQTIAVYGAHAPGLPLLTFADISGDGHEVSSVAIVPEQKSLFVSSFCDGSRLWVYDLETLKLRGTLPLSEAIPRIQGISWNSATGEFAVTSDDAGQTIGFVYRVSRQGQVVGPVFTTPEIGELEGVDYTQGIIRYLIGGIVYSLRPRSPLLGADCPSLDCK